MHFALVTAPTITEFRTTEEIGSRAVQRAALQPQLGVLSVAAVLERCGDTPHVWDANAEYLRFAADAGTDRIDDFAQHLAETVVRSNADVYGFSSICSTFPLSLRVARALKEMRPYATVLFGGPQASVVDVPVVSTFPFVDYILRGEAEDSLPVFYRELTGSYDFARVPSLTYRDGGTARRTPSAAVIEDLDLLPSPAYHLSSYLHGSPAASIELGRGCPFSCSFCSTNDFFRRRFRLRSPQRVLADMRAIAATHGIRHFELVHDMFTVDRKRVVAFCEAMQASGEGFTWDCSARTDCVDDELLQQMAASGCIGLFFGIESGSRRMQRLIDKDLDPDRAEEMLRVCERLGIRTTASLITGFPQEEWADVRDTLRIYMQSARCSRSHPQLNLLAPLAGTPMHVEHRHELVLEDHCSDMSHQGLSHSEEDQRLIEAHPEIFPNFYMIPTPKLDRDVLFELREFLGMAVERSRWLLAAIAAEEDILDVHALWRAWRTERNGVMTKAELRQYYAGPVCHTDFLAFVRGSALGEVAVISALLDVDEALQSAASTARRQEETPAEVLQRDGLQGGGLQVGGEWMRLAPGVHRLRLAFNLAEVTQAVATGSTSLPTGQFHYATRVEGSGAAKVVSISPFLDDVLSICGRSDADALKQTIAAGLGIAEDEDVDTACAAMMQHLRQDGWLDAVAVG